MLLKIKKTIVYVLMMFSWTEALPKKVWEAFWANPCLAFGTGDVDVNLTGQLVV